MARTITTDNAGRLYVGGFFTSSTATFGATTLPQAGPGQSTGFVARLTSGPLATHAPAPGRLGLDVWPNPTNVREVWVRGAAPGQLVRVLDLLGREVGRGQMPPVGALKLKLPDQLSPGVYLVSISGQAQQLVVE
ncbi:T9SS type A sorting domain-containing protein [Hymenobacter saemangeumensis]|uniref:T9SS type A sorting domain-containing protein n=1 Tax=Hymenobacter saemangeumensis TaxID=1084522 RepID=UPI0031E5E73C